MERMGICSKGGQRYFSTSYYSFLAFVSEQITLFYVHLFNLPHPDFLAP